MKKIIISLSIIGAVAVAATGATMALFNDTETSTGNVFTAGSVDLKVDHTLQTYNGVNCATCSVEVVSDTTNMVVKRNGVVEPSMPFNAVAVSPLHPAWTASIPGATWIWAYNPAASHAPDTAGSVTYTFEKTFTWNGPTPLAAWITFSVAADNNYNVYVNGVLVASDVSGNNYTSADGINPVFIAPHLITGVNTLRFEVTNLNGATDPNNPAGLLYKLTIKGDCGNEYFQNHCSLWQATDLNPQHQFFNFNDIKPGDYGTNVISLHIRDNDSYACLLTDAIEDNENTLVDPEMAAGDVTPGPLGNGELSGNLNFFGWLDDGDGMYEPPTETVVLQPNTPMDMIPTEIVAMSLTSVNPINVGLAWCAGAQSVGGNGAISCNGATMGNTAQTDSVIASLVAYAEQKRNNPNFDCENVNLHLTPRPSQTQE